ncbi:MAG: FAD:protein FMN transferase [Leeuwenhoekiella sp.]
MKNILIVAVVAFMAIGCQQRQELVLRSFSGGALGTGYTVKFYAENPFAVEKKFDSLIDAVNQSMSTYQQDSDISRINAGDSTVVVDAMFREVFELAKEVYKNSNGYFDPTVGILANAYGFGPDKPSKVLDSTVLDSLRKFVGLDLVKIDAENRIIKKYPEVYLDFNSIAKGYCVDRVAKMLDANGVENYLIELGGELFAKGENLVKEQPWAVGIEDINSDKSNRGYTEVIYLKNSGMAGSGNYRKYRVDEETGQRYVHTIDPLTGKAEQSNVLAATIVATSCAEADAYATACMAMGFANAKTMLAKLPKVKAYLTYSVLDSTDIFMTENFRPLLRDYPNGSN